MALTGMTNHISMDNCISYLSFAAIIMILTIYTQLQSIINPYPTNITCVKIVDLRNLLELYQNVVILYTQHGFISTEHIIPYLSPSLYWLQFNDYKLYSLITLYITGIYTDRVSLIIYWRKTLSLLLDIFLCRLNLATMSIHLFVKDLTHHQRTHPNQVLCLKKFHIPYPNDGICLLVFVFPNASWLKSKVSHLIFSKLAWITI